MDLLERKDRLPAIPLLFLTPPFDTPISEDGKFVSEQTYWEKYYEHPDFNYEWVNGRLEEKPVSNNATYWMFSWLEELLKMFLQMNKIAKLTGLEMGFTVPLSPEKQLIRNKKRKNVRKPDLAVVLNSNPVPANANDNSYSGIPDICIEAISYTTKKAKERDTIHKREEYEYACVKEFYILDDRKKETAFLRLDRWGIYQEINRIDGDIIRSEVLPGFQFRISDLYCQPDLDELVKDEVYQGFVMVKYQEQKKRAEKAESQLVYELQEKQEAFRQVQEERKQKQEALRLAEEQRKQKQEALRLAEEQRKQKQEALRLAEEERLEKEEALRLAEEQRKKNERLLALLTQSGISLD